MTIVIVTDDRDIDESELVARILDIFGEPPDDEPPAPALRLVA